MINMTEYKCICCGAVKESEKACTCANCGYKMYPMPYERKQVLADEIGSFINYLKLGEIEPSEISFVRKEPRRGKHTDEPGEQTFLEITKEEDDEAHFPTFRMIQDYVCAGKKLEDFFTRLRESLAELNVHIHTPYQRTYEADYEELKARVLRLDSVLQKALTEIGIEAGLQELKPPVLRLDYQETPNEALLGRAEEILALLDQLAAKIRRFIKLNNIYETGYRRALSPEWKNFREKSSSEALDMVKALLRTVLDKKYTVDLFSDGSRELEEQLRVLWTAVYAIMRLPVLQKNYAYRFEDGDTAEGDGFTKKLAAKLRYRYAEIREPVLDAAYLAEHDEDELFELYNKMIVLDIFGAMGLNPAKLMRVGASEKELSSLIGLSGIKDSIKKIKAYAIANKGSEALNLHMCFCGNPGTGKTEAARIIAGILYENKILPTKNVVEVDRGGLVGQFVGETPQKTMAKIRAAMGGVLFIDEAYALVPKDGAGDYGHEAVATLIKAMEDHRGEFCVILAGYQNPMREMLASNPGFRSRIQFSLDFPNYSREELGEILDRMLAKRGYTMDDAAKEKILDITDVKRKEPDFANAREVRNILDQVIMCQNVRTGGAEDRALGSADVNRYLADAKLNLPTGGVDAAKKILTGEEELECLIGLSNVKRMVKKIRAYAKKNKDDSSFNLHMCFFGNPGTGKTEVARILSRILYDAGVLPESKLVETDSTGLIGRAVGETGPKTKEKVQEAMGGVLFIDEAYQLEGDKTVSGASLSYGDEAIAVLLKEMEDHRGQFCVILAGYKEEMQSMLSSNPGFASRIQFKLDFPDYTREELREIAKRFLAAKQYKIEDAALDKVLDVTEYYRKMPNFANARTLRNVLDQVIMNQNLRAEDDADDFTIILSDVEDYIADEGIDLSKTADTHKIGFSID